MPEYIPHKHVICQNMYLKHVNTFQELSMKGVTAVCKLGLSDVPFTVYKLNISGISELRDQMFSTLFQKVTCEEAILGVSSFYLFIASK